MGDIASLDQTLLSPRPLLHQLDLVGPCRQGSYQLKTSPFLYGRYDSNPLPTESRPSNLPSNPTALASLPLTLPLGGARWTWNTNVTRTLSDSSGGEKRQKRKKTIAQKSKAANKRIPVVEPSVCTSSVSAHSRADGNNRNLPSEEPSEQSFPAVQVPAVDSRSEAHTSVVPPFSPHTQYTGMPSVKSKPSARPRKMDRRMLRQKRTSISTPVQKACAYLEARTIADDCITKDMDEVARMALRSNNYDWSRRVPDGRGNPSEEGYYAVARCAGQHRSVQETGTYSCRQTLSAVMGGVSPQMLQHPQQGSYVTPSAQENCHGYLYSTASISPDLLMQRATLMGETGPAAEKLKQIAAQHQLKESSRYAEIDGVYVDEYPGYPYRQTTELYPVGAQYPLSGTPYPEAAYLLSSVVQYPGRIDSEVMDQDISSESGFGSTKPLSHYPVNNLSLANQIAQPDHIKTNDPDSTNQERLLYRDPKRPASLTNRQAINYGDANQRNQDSFQTMSANRVPPEYHATDDIMNNNGVTHRTMMEQYGRQLQNARMFASEYSKQGDTSTHPCLVTSVPTAVEPPSSRSHGGTEELARRSVQLPPNSPFLSTPSAVNYCTNMEMGLPSSNNDRGRTLADPRWTIPGHHSFVVGGEEMSVLADINGNGEFPDLTGHSPGLDCGISPMLTGKRKPQSGSSLVSPASGYHYAPENSAQSTLPNASFSDSAGVTQTNERPRYCAREMTGVPSDFSENPVWPSVSQAAQPQGTSGFDVDPTQWGRYYQPLQNNSSSNAFSGSPYALGNSLFPDGAAVRKEATHGAVSTGGGGGGSPTMDFGNRWTAPSASSDAEKDLHRPQPNGGHLASCQFSSSSSSNSSSSSSSSSSAASTASSSTTQAAVPPPPPPPASAVTGSADFVGSGCEDDVELFSYVDDDSPVELNFIDDLLSATR